MRRRRIVVNSLLAVFLIVSAPVTHGQAGSAVPRVIAFSGALPGASGRITVRFALFADAASDTPVWSETQVVTVDDRGRYTVILGAADSDGLPIEIFVAGSAKWLGVHAEGYDDPARVLLVSAPFALKAADADTLGGKPLSAFVLAQDVEGGPGRRSDAGDGKGAADGFASPRPASSPAGGAAQTSGTANYLGLFTDSVNLGNSVLFQAPGTNRIGIGTTAPGAPFHSVGRGAFGTLIRCARNAVWASRKRACNAAASAWAPASSACAACCRASASADVCCCCCRRRLSVRRAGST